MRVLIAPDDTASGLYRLREPARVLAAAGHDVAVMDPATTWRVLDPQDGHAPVLLDDPPEADVVVFQRVMRGWRVAAIRALQQAGIAVVVEIDDDMHAVPETHPSYRHCHPHWHHEPHERSGLPVWRYDPSRLAEQGRHWLTEACETADLVTCTTPALAARYGAHGRVKVLPNLVPSWYLEVGREVRDSSSSRQEQPDKTVRGGLGTHLPDNPPVIGWSGTVATHPGDLEVTGGAVAHVARDTGAGVHIVGTGHGVRAALRLDQEPSTVGRWVSLTEYPLELARLDAGIIPLADTPFNHAKSALKAGEMAAVGVPVVMSPTPDNRRLHRAGLGVIAKHPPEWRRHLSRLVTDPDRRAELAALGRAVMARRTYEEHAGRWWDAWTTAAEQRARQRRRGRIAA